VFTFAEAQLQVPTQGFVRDRIIRKNQFLFIG